MENIKEKLLNATAAADELQITVSTLWRWRKLGCPVHVFDNVGIRIVYMYDIDEVRAWFKARRAALDGKGMEA